MIKAIESLILLLLLISCSKDNPFQPIQYESRLKGSLNNQNWDGDGITFLREDSTLHIRGFLGTHDYHHQIDIVLENLTSGTYSLDSAVQSAVVSEIYGMDIVGAEFSPNDSSYISVELDSEKENISGEIFFLGFSSPHNKSISLSCTFDLEIGENYGKWTCDYMEDGIYNCRLID